MPGENLNTVAAEQIRSWLEQAGPQNTVPIFTFDAGYDAVQLRLALADLQVGLLVRLPWQPPLAAERSTPARVRRGFSQVLAHLGSPVCAPKPCGRSPGRPIGKRPPPATRFPAVKLTP